MLISNSYHAGWNDFCIFILLKANVLYVENISPNYEWTFTTSHTQVSNDLKNALFDRAQLLQCLFSKKTFYGC